VSAIQVTAVVPAALLQPAHTAQVFVLTGDPQADVPPARTASAAFLVAGAPPPPAQTDSAPPRGAPQAAGRTRSGLPTVFDVTLAGGTLSTSGKLRASDPYCLYWMDPKHMELVEPCYAYRIVVQVNGLLKACLTWPSKTWVSFRDDRLDFLPTRDASPWSLSWNVTAGDTVVLTVGNHASAPEFDYHLDLQLLPTSPSQTAQSVHLGEARITQRP